MTSLQLCSVRTAQRGNGAATPRALLPSQTMLETTALTEGASGVQLIAGALGGRNAATGGATVPGARRVPTRRTSSARQCSFALFALVVASCSPDPAPSVGGVDASLAGSADDLTMDGRSDPVDGALVTCGVIECTGSAKLCCSDDYGHTGICGTPLGDFCGQSGTLTTTCDGPEDCGVGSGCCQSQRRSAFHCIAGGCGPGAARLCHVDEDCVRGESCCPFTPQAPSFKRCVVKC